MGKKEKKLINLKRVKELFEYSDNSLTWKINKGLAKKGDKARINNMGYKIVKFDGISYLEHRILWALHKGSQPDIIDHIDGDTLNNNIENLREATHSQNMRNSKLYKNNKSGIKGVYWDSEKRKWKATLRYNGKENYLGRFDDLSKAEKVVQEARIKYHNQYANTGTY